MTVDTKRDRDPEVLAIDAFPFVVHLLETPDNPAGVPNHFPFHLRLDEGLGHLYQPDQPDLAAMLARAYQAGSLLGTAMDDTDSGRSYADDFLRFVRQHLKAGTKCLEIGAGRGFLTRRLLDAGLSVDALEPGIANEVHWRRHNVQVIADSFPSGQLQEKYDAILAYAVMEHIAELSDFLAHVTRQLAPGGRLIVAVPDCSTCIATGDPSILLHEHYHYFTAASLGNTLARGGFRANAIETARYGGVLYCSAVPELAVRTDDQPLTELTAARNYGKAVARQRSAIAKRLQMAAAKGRRIGIYCPNRVLGLLPVGIAGIRFFDDDPDQLDKYFPSFAMPIENRAMLLAEPTDEVWIMSRSFGTRIRNRLRGEAGLATTKIFLIEEILT